VVLSQEDIVQIVNNVVKHGFPTWREAEKKGVSQRRVQQLVKYYREHKEYPVLRKAGRKPKGGCSRELYRKIIRIARRRKCGAVQIAKELRNNYGIKIGNNKVHEILKVVGMAKEEAKKRVRKRDWVRYEREYPLSALHIDWYHNSRGQWLCAIEDDASRMILAAGEYPRRSTESVITLMDEVIEKYGHIKLPESIIVDHGAEFYGVKRDKHGNADHRFEQYCKDKGIKIIYCRVKHPQTNGKLERWFREYERRRWEARFSP